MFNHKTNKINKLLRKKGRLSPNFLDSVDGLDILPKKIIKVKKEIISKVQDNQEYINDKKNYFIKSVYNLESVVLKKIRYQHKRFDNILKESEKKINKKRKVFLFFNKKDFKKKEPNLDNNKFKSLFHFFIILLILVLPFKIMASFNIFDIKSLEERVINNSKSAIYNLITAGSEISELNMVAANNRFASAGSDFLKISEDTEFVNDAILSLASFSSDPKLKLAAESKKFIKIGLIGSNLGQELTAALSSLNVNDGNWITILDDFSAHGKKSLSYARELNKELKKINVNNLPEEYRSIFIEISSKAEKIPESLSLIVENTNELKTFLGSGRDKRYLLIFQNNAEMRGSGGFLGGYALVDFREGKIRNMEVPGGGSYDTEAGLTESIKAPEPLWLVNPRWHFWDANWWPDFPTTAKNLMWFYEKSDGPSVDGVISFTPSVVEKLLTVTGPIDMTKDYGVVIDANNFWQQVQLTTEREHVIKKNPDVVSHLPVGEENKPKKIIGDLLNKMVEILPSKLNKENLVKLFSITEDSLSSKQVMFYFKDSNLQSKISERNWAGEMIKAPLDYLMVVNTNIAGAKTDKVITEDITQDINILEDGSVVSTVTITRKHNALKNEPLVGVRNVNWLRVYVPFGSQLISSSGFSIPDEKYFEKPNESWLDNEFILETEGKSRTTNDGVKIYEENGKVVFANWSMVDPGNTSVVVLSYKLPFNIFSEKRISNNFLTRLNSWLNNEKNIFYEYSLLIQKQPGSENQSLLINLNKPESKEIIWQSGDLPLMSKINQDSFYSFLLSVK
jgi:hypothetical protein